MSKVVIKSSGKTEFLYKSFSILVVIVAYLSMSMSVLYAAANINQQPNVTADATRQDVMNRLANITRTVNNDLPQKISNGLRWTDFGYTQEGDHGVPELIFTYELDMKAIYGPSCPDGQLPEGFLDVFKNNILAGLRPEMKNGYRGISKSEFLNYKIGVAIIFINPAGNRIGTIFYSATDIFL